MKKIFLLVIMTISIFAGRYNINESIFVDNGWVKPLNRTLTTSTNYDYESQTYYNNHHFWHGAVDIIANLNEKVYSIADGKVIDIYRKTSSSKNMSVLYIKYKTKDNKEFLVIYGHVYGKNGLKKNDTVKQGEYIGNIRRYANPDHVHFGITTNLNYHGSSFGSSASWTGVVNPLDFLSNHKNNSNNSNNTISGIFDGAGSIISAKEQGAGKNFDIAKMHPHPGTGSTVVFQWLYDEDTCTQLDIRSEYDIGDVIISSKAWDNHLTEKAIKVRLDEGMPITIKRPNNDNVWTTFAITTTKSLTYGNRIVAECKTSNDTFETGTRTEVSKDLVNVTHNYFWTGTGSIISTANRNFNPPYGMTADLAVTFKKFNSLTSFQWLKKGSCKKLKISTNGNSSINSVHIKKWDAESWGDSKCSSLPCTLTPSNDNYYVIKVKSSPDAISSGSLYAECVQ